MNMKGSFLMTALMAGAMISSGMGNSYGRSYSGYEPNISEEKKILPGKFKGTIPKGCKITTVPIEVKCQGYMLTKYVDIIYGSEKAKQKAIIKARYAVKEYLRDKKHFREGVPVFFHEFDDVLEIIEEVNLPLTRFIEDENENN